MLRAFFLMLMLFSLTIVCSAQTKQSSPNNQAIPASGEEDVIKVNTSLINLPIIASDKGGRYLPNLKAEDFAIYENGIKQEIDLFSNNTTPFSVVLLVDASGSVDDDFQSIRSATKDFISNIRNEDRVKVVSFADSIVTHIDFTSDKAKLTKAVMTMIPGGSTRLNDALYNVARNLKSVEGRKAVILLSDGIDTVSGRTIEEACRELEESGALVYVVSYPSERIITNPGAVRIYGTNQTLRDQDRRHQIYNGDTPYFNPGNNTNNNSNPLINNDNNGPGKGNDNPIFPGGNTATPNRDNIPNLPGGGKGGKGGRDLINQHNSPYQLNGQSNSPFINVGYQGLVYTSVLDFIVVRNDAILFRAHSLASLAEPMKIIADQLRHIYSIAYYPSNPIEKGGYRKVEVKMVKEKKAKLRYKRGYNANNFKTLKTASF